MIAALLAIAAVAGFAPWANTRGGTWPPGPVFADYQLGGAYQPPPGVEIVVRDVTAEPAPGAYNVCYVNAFQTQPGAKWPRSLVLRRLGDDPNWPGEYLLDIRKGARVAERIGRQIRACARRGFDAVELDNLDSWTRFDDVPFGRRAAVAYAKRLVRIGHREGLAVAQKNTPQLRRRHFDFAVAEECGRYRECGEYKRLYGDRVLAIEYTRKGFEVACRALGSVVLRDADVTAPGSRTYVYDAC